MINAGVDFSGKLLEQTQLRLPIAILKMSGKHGVPYLEGSLEY